MNEHTVASDESAGAYAQFRRLLDREDKEACVQFAVTILGVRTLNLVSLYQEVLAPAAREPFNAEHGRAVGVWEEHVRTSILRTVIECCYPEVMRARKAVSGVRTRGSALIVCPAEEYHELGARMASDFFTLCGFDVTFVGANTPLNDVLDAVETIEPVYVGVSVTGPYNLIAARRTIQQLTARRSRSGGRFRIVAGGQAFGQDVNLAASLGADLLAQSFDDIRRLSEEIPWLSL